MQKLGSKFPNTLRLCEDFGKSHLMPNQFDIVVCFDGLPQMDSPNLVLEKMVEMVKPGGLVVFNFFTPNDCAFGEGERIDEYTYSFKDTLFKFFTMQQTEEILPSNVQIEKKELRVWDDPPHGEFRPEPHKHEAAYFILRRM